MIGSSSHERALAAALKEPLELRLTMVKKTLTAIEQGDVKPTHRIFQALRACIRSVLASTTDTGVIQACADYKIRIRSIDPRRAEAQAAKSADNLLSSCSGATSTALNPNSDPWHAPPPLPRLEQRRLVDIEAPFRVFDRGFFILRTDVDASELIRSALDGREPTVANLLKLQNHLKLSFDAGGIVLVNGPLFTEVTKILRAQGIAEEKLAETPDLDLVNFFEKFMARS